MIFVAGVAAGFILAHVVMCVMASSRRRCVCVTADELGLTPFEADRAVRSAAQIKSRYRNDSHRSDVA